MKVSIIKVIFSWRLFVVFFLGISSGIPLLVTGSTLQAWMTDEGIDLAVIGLFSLVGLPYTFKFLWAPVMDRYVPPFFDRRRGWILTSQVLLIMAIGSFFFVRPSQYPWIVAFLAMLVSFFSASQDIVIDAYRREILRDEELGLGSSLAVNGYRIGMLISGAFALLLADSISWNLVYLLLASSLFIGIITTLLAANIKERIVPPQTLREAVIEPFTDYFKRKGAVEILAFILLYKIGDIMANTMLTPFILKMGFTKIDLATIAKTFGMAATIAGGLLGGVFILQLGLFNALWIFGILQAISTLSFSALAYAGKYHSILIFTVTFENLTSGMGISAFTAFMASLCNKRFTATQYALLSSLMGIPRVIVSSPTGLLAERLGWVYFFIFCTLIAIPGLIFLLRYNSWQNVS